MPPRNSPPERPLVQLKMSTRVRWVLYPDAGFSNVLMILSICDSLQCVSFPQDNVGRDEPLHAAVQALPRVRAIEEPRRARAPRVRDGLAASRPPRFLQALDERRRKLLLCVGWRGTLCDEKAPRELHGERRVLVLVRARQTELDLTERRGLGDDDEFGCLSVMGVSLMIEGMHGGSHLLLLCLLLENRHSLLRLLNSQRRNTLLRNFVRFARQRSRDYETLP